MLVVRKFSDQPRPALSWESRWEGPDEGLVCAWLRGIEKATQDPELAARAQAGELPILGWKGGVERPVKVVKTGSVLYLATWQGLRGEDLMVDTDRKVSLTCSRTGVAVEFVADPTILLAAGADIGRSA